MTATVSEGLDLQWFAPDTGRGGGGGGGGSIWSFQGLIKNEEGFPMVNNKK